MNYGKSCTFFKPQKIISIFFSSIEILQSFHFSKILVRQSVNASHIHGYMYVRDFALLLIR